MSEFARMVRLDELGAAPRRMAIAATAPERAALAERFDLVAVAALAADVEIVRDGDVVRLAGRMTAAVTQSCVITAEPLDARIDVPLSLRFEPEDSAADEEIELDEADLDVMAYAGSAIDIGEAVAQSLLLALDPFPRAPDAEAVLKDVGVLSEDEVKPISPLAAALQAKLGR